MSNKPPALDELADHWSAHWERKQTYRFDRSAPAERIFAIDTPPPTASGALHIGHVFSYTHTDVIARFQRMRGKAVFYPIGWDDNGLATERRVQMYFGVRCDPSLPYEQDLRIEPAAAKDSAQRPVSRRNFIELCHQLTAIDETAFEEVFRQVGLSVDWSLLYTTIGDRSRKVSQLAFLRALGRGEAYHDAGPTLWDTTFQTAVAQAELEDRERPGAYHRLSFAGDAGPITIATTRPELLPACVALVAHPDDERYQALFGTEVSTPVFGARVPVLAHRLADPTKGTGIAMVCTFGDTTDVVWWRELDLPTRSILGFDGRLLPEPPPGLSPDGELAYAKLAGQTAYGARQAVLELLRTSGELLGEPEPITHAVKFYERGERPLEIVSTRQWYLRNGGRDTDLRSRLLDRGRELTWSPPYMRTRYEHWVSGLAGDWLISRQRFYGVPIPVWYQLDESGQVQHDQPLLPDESSLPVDPSSDTPPGYRPEQRGLPGGFIGDADVMDTWATSSLTPQIAGGWAGTPQEQEQFSRLFPFALRPQAHEIIRTWLFTTVLRAHLEHGTLPWRHAAISGWILDPDRKKMGKSLGNALTPIGMLREHGADAVRYWAAAARPGADTALDTGQMKVGRRLATKILNASHFVKGLSAQAPTPNPVDHVPSAVMISSPPPQHRDHSAPLRTVGSVDSTPTEPLDLALLAALRPVIDEVTAALEAYDHARALEATERFFWLFCDDYLELVKARAYGTDAGAASARATLHAALSVLLRLFAPALPFVTEEAWSWSHDRAARPDSPVAKPDGATTPTTSANARPDSKIAPATSATDEPGGATGVETAAAWAGEPGGGTGTGTSAAADGEPGSVHLAAWPTGAELASGGDPALLATAREAIGAIRAAKSAAKLSMRAPVAKLTLHGDASAWNRLTTIIPDLREAGQVAEFVHDPRETTTSYTVTLA